MTKVADGHVGLSSHIGVIHCPLPLLAAKVVVFLEAFPLILPWSIVVEVSTVVGVLVSLSKN